MLKIININLIGLLMLPYKINKFSYTPPHNEKKTTKFTLIIYN